MCLADGQPLNVLGQIEGKITLGLLKVTHNFIVAEIKAIAIIGIDFLTQHEGAIDLKRAMLNLHNTNIPMWLH